ncbi:MAG: hypothetical protein COA38_05190 [Fluviicola sp.]|nr:MAG: hypothetical protein COA38_05190 [Fluviicola sp.]
MEREVMDIVRDKEFIELTAAERAELGELCSSEDEYNQVKNMFAGISAMDWSNPAPKAETKESLDHLFAQKHPKAAPVWYNAPLAVIAPKGKPFYRQPLVQAAAVGLLMFLAYPLVNTGAMDAKTNQVADLDTEMTSSKAKESDKRDKEDREDSDVIDANEIDNKLIDAKKEVVLNKPEPVVLDVPNATMPIAAAAPADPAFTAFAFSTTTSVVATREITIKDASTSGAAELGSTHPDGIFVGDVADVFSAPASDQPAVFDLLTSTF